MKVAIIPARGGSKRIPHKNIREFLGKPIITYPIELAIGSGIFDRVIVSTDDEQIAEVAQMSGAEVPFVRPKNFSDDQTGTGEVVAHAIEWLSDSGCELSAVCCIYATAVFLREKDLRLGLEIIENESWNYVFSAASFPSAIFRAFYKNSTGGLDMYFPERYDTRSQDLPGALHDAAQFYWGHPGAWCNRTEVFGKDSTVVIVPRWRVQDIDTLEDWQQAEVTYKVLQDLQRRG